MSITTPAFREDKAAEAVHFLLMLGGGHLDIYSVVKFLYLANRTTMFERHRSITNDSLASLPFGPVPSNTYDCLKKRHICGEYWKSLIKQRVGNKIPAAKIEHEYQYLSQIDQQNLTKTFEEYKGLSFGELKDITHAFPEWTDPNGSSLPIDVQEMYEKNGIKKESFEAYIEYAEIQSAMQQLGNRE